MNEFSVTGSAVCNLTLWFAYIYIQSEWNLKGEKGSGERMNECFHATCLHVNSHVEQGLPNFQCASNFRNSFLPLPNWEAST